MQIFLCCSNARHTHHGTISPGIKYKNENRCYRFPSIPHDISGGFSLNRILLQIIDCYLPLIFNVMENK